MDKIEKIENSSLALRYQNYRKKDKVEYELEMNNARYEGAMRSDFRQPPRVDEYTYDNLEVVRIV